MLGRSSSIGAANCKNVSEIFRFGIRRAPVHLALGAIQLLFSAYLDKPIPVSLACNLSGIVMPNFLKILLLLIEFEHI
jgi:hypothetical protein